MHLEFSKFYLSRWLWTSMKIFSHCWLYIIANFEFQITSKYAYILSIPKFQNFLFSKVFAITHINLQQVIKQRHEHPKSCSLWGNWTPIYKIGRVFFARRISPGKKWWQTHLGREISCSQWEDWSMHWRCLAFFPFKFGGGKDFVSFLPSSQFVPSMFPLSSPWVPIRFSICSPRSQCVPPTCSP